MKKLNLTTISALAVFGLAACNGSATNTVNTTNMNRAAMNTNSNVAVVVNSNANTMMNTMSNTAGGNVSSIDQEFMDKALQGGMKEVQIGGIAAAKAQNVEVKAFAQKMINDHSRANNELRDLAKQIGVTPVGGTNSEQQKEMSELSRLSGAAFDKEYVKKMVEDHEKDVAEFQKQSDGGTNGNLKKFAAETLPTLKMHLEMIKEIQGKLK